MLNLCFLQERQLNSSRNYVQSQQKVGPNGRRYKNAAILAVIFSMICMAAYIMLRFRDIAFSAGAFASVASTTLCIIAFYVVVEVLPILYGGRSDVRRGHLDHHRLLY